MKKIVPCLWFDNEAEEAAKFYVDIFNGSPTKEKESKVLDTTYLAAETPSNKPIGSVLTVEFELEGQKYMALNGGPEFKFTEALSLIIECYTQEEIDYYTEKLSAVPEAEICGWVKDKYGVSWQISPKLLDEMLKDKDKEKAKRATEAMLKMKKLDIAELEKAFNG
jgi:predicted 3-demethylubiquinone-9 3-methyltransferase (glyoxalase superfamily)